MPSVPTALDQVEKSTSYECDGKAIKAKKRSSCVGLLTETETIRTNTTAGAQELMSALITTSYTVKEWFGDCFTLKYKILFFGSVVSLLLALVYVFLMKYIAGVLVWVLIVLVWLLLGLVSTMLLVKGGSFFWLEFSFAQIEVLSGQLSNREFKEVAALFDATEGVEQKVWCYAGHTAFVVTLVYMVAICAIQSQIKLAIRLIEVTAKIMQSIPLIVVAPVIEWACLLALGAYFALGVANIWTAELSTADLKAALATSTSLDCDAKGDVVDCVTRTFGPTNATASPLDNTTDESAFYPMMGWHIFGYLWCWQFYVGFKTVWTGDFPSAPQHRPSRSLAARRPAALLRVLLLTAGRFLFPLLLLLLLLLRPRLLLSFAAPSSPPPPPPSLLSLSLPLHSLLSLLLPLPLSPSLSLSLSLSLPLAPSLSAPSPLSLCLPLSPLSPFSFSLPSLPPLPSPFSPLSPSLSPSLSLFLPFSPCLSLSLARSLPLSALFALSPLSPLSLCLPLSHSLSLCPLSSPPLPSPLPSPLVSPPLLSSPLLSSHLLS